jgi:hypothetical protein
MHMARWIVKIATARDSNGTFRIEDALTGQAIARVCGIPFEAGVSENAHLMAAAPELMEELKVAVARMKEAGWVTDLAEELIARTEGRGK